MSANGNQRKSSQYCNKPKMQKSLNEASLIIHFVLLFIVLLLICPQKAFLQEKSNLRFLTINVWSGLDYNGTFRMGEYESAERRKSRFLLLIEQIKRINPDVIFLQEANPVARFTDTLADSLDFEKIHQVCLAGIKFGPLGFPTNIKEGMSILARPSLNLEKFDVWKLSGSFGVYGDAVTIQFDESIFAVVGKITFQNTPIYLVNVHLVSSPPKDPYLTSKFESLVKEEKISKEKYKNGIKIWELREERRINEVKKLSKFISGLPPESPVIVAGDFNATPDSQVIQLFQSRSNPLKSFFDVYPFGTSGRLYSWNPRDNKNILFSSKKTDARGIPREGYDYLSALGAEIPRRIDYIFLSHHFNPENVLNCFIGLDSLVEGIQASDHYGVLAEVNFDSVLQTSPKEFKTVTPIDRSKIELFPILMYDTSTGFGYGAKIFYLNPLKWNESFDLVLFNSTKGEQWYRLTFSWPDFEQRQGKIYPLAFDLMIDYDKWIKNSFFGIGSNSEFEDREYYTREPFELRLTFSRGFSTYIVGQIGASYKTIGNSNFSEESCLENLQPELNHLRVNAASFFLNLRYDTRDSFINPSRGLVLQGEAEIVPDTSLSNVAFTRLSIWLHHYYTLFYPKTVMAIRLGLQSLSGEDLPVQVLLPIGGNRTLRGFPQDRFLGKTSAVFNAELRFPLYWRLGGVIGFDAGKVWDSPNKIDLCRWATNPTVGLRLYMDTFVIRADIGFGKDTTGFYFNFGHIF